MLEKIWSKGISAQETCSEETLLYQLVSGLHASVNMHISTHYVDDDLREFANHSMYLNGLGRHPDRIKNLHMLYALVIRSVNLIHSQLTKDSCDYD